MVTDHFGLFGLPSRAEPKVPGVGRVRPFDPLSSCRRLPSPSLRTKARHADYTAFAAIQRAFNTRFIDCESDYCATIERRAGRKADLLDEASKDWGRQGPPSAWVACPSFFPSFCAGLRTSLSAAVPENHKIRSVPRSCPHFFSGPRNPLQRGKKLLSSDVHCCNNLPLTLNGLGARFSCLCCPLQL